MLASRVRMRRKQSEETQDDLILFESNRVKVDFSGYNFTVYDDKIELIPEYLPEAGGVMSFIFPIMGEATLQIDFSMFNTVVLNFTGNITFQIISSTNAPLLVNMFVGDENDQEINISDITDMGWLGLISTENASIYKIALVK